MDPLPPPGKRAGRRSGSDSADILFGPSVAGHRFSRAFDCRRRESARTPANGEECSTTDRDTRTLDGVAERLSVPDPFVATPVSHDGTPGNGIIVSHIRSGDTRGSVSGRSNAAARQRAATISGPEYLDVDRQQ